MDRRTFVAAGAAAGLLAAPGRTTPAQAATTPVKIGWGAFPDVPQIAQASDKGLWAGQGLSPQIIPFATGRDSFEALIGGQLDLAVMAEFPPVTGALRGRKFGVAAVLSRYRALRAIARSATPVTAVKDLAGRRVATSIGTNVHFLIGEALRREGVAAKLVNVGPADMIPALLRGDVDAATPFPSAYPAARRALGDAYQQVMLPDAAQSFVLVASERLAAGDQDLVARVLRVLLEGERLVDADPAESQEATARYVRGAVTLEGIRSAWPEYEFRVQLDQGTLDLMVRAATWIVEQGFVRDVEPSAALIMQRMLPGPLRNVAPDRVTIQGA